jgi:hypothetical protein
MGLIRLFFNFIHFISSRSSDVAIGNAAQTGFSGNGPDSSQR